MVTQTETEQANKSADVDVKRAAMCRRMTLDSLASAERLEPGERRLVVLELAVAIWLKSFTLRGPTYPGFEAFLLTHFSKKNDLEQYIYPFIVDDRVHNEAKALYGEYLRGMFGASGKTRSQFYDDMCLEIGIQGCLDSVGFGERASEFFDKVIGTLHDEHLLVAYSVRLFLKALMARQPRESATIPDQDQEVIYRHFENSFPLCGKFRKYAKDDRFFTSCLDNGILSEIK